MNILIGCGAVMQLLTLSNLAAQTLEIEIGVYDYSNIAGDILLRAEQESTRIFQYTGVRVVWRSCLTGGRPNRICAWPESPTRLTLSLLSNQMAAGLEPAGDIFGKALLPDMPGFGVMANIYADRTREIAKGRDLWVILGRVMAHEIGHLLLARRGHAAAGIMHTPWSSRDLESTSAASMVFLPEEARRMRAQVAARAANVPPC